MKKFDGRLKLHELYMWVTVDEDGQEKPIASNNLIICTDYFEQALQFEKVILEDASIKDKGIRRILLGGETKEDIRKVNGEIDNDISLNALLEHESNTNENGLFEGASFVLSEFHRYELSMTVTGEFKK